MEKINIHDLYKSNNLLSAAFILLLTLTLFIALFLGYQFMAELIQSRFYANKSEVLDSTIQPYNELVYDKLQEISYYQGFLDSTSATEFINSNFADYSFIKSIYFFDLEVGNHPIEDGLRVEGFSAEAKEVYEFKREGEKRFKMRKVPKNTEFFTKLNNSMVNSMLKLTSYIQIADTSQALTPEDQFNIFYTITNNSVSYLNALRRDDIAVYKQLMFNDSLPEARYDQDLMLFNLDPYAITIKNRDPALYEQVLIKPVVFDSLETSRDHMVTDIALSGAFADYKLYFISSKDHVTAQIINVFRPIAVMVIIVYGLLILMAYLLFRNLKINRRMFKLQYDFINNLTHEFKTPVSVIKIAGNNIKVSKELSEKELQHYGKILDEESDKLNDLMTKLLSFTQIESKSIKIRKDKINMEVFCQNLVDEYQIRYPGFHIDYHISGVEYIEGDKVLLGSVFANLIENAYKYSPPDRRYLFIDVRRLRKNLVVRFIDQGIGIDKKEQEHIFKRFYKVENDFNRHGSVGIGLAFCKEVINYMEGSISVKSEPGKGSEFIILLPLHTKS